MKPPGHTLLCHGALQRCHSKVSEVIDRIKIPNDINSAKIFVNIQLYFFHFLEKFLKIRDNTTFVSDNRDLEMQCTMLADHQDKWV